MTHPRETEATVEQALAPEVPSHSAPSHTSDDEKKRFDGATADVERALTREEDEDSKWKATNGKWNSFRRSPVWKIARDFAMIGLLLGIWIPSIVREETRHNYWVITTILCWFFILLILFHHSKYIPQAPFVRVISATWSTCLGKPWGKLSYKIQLTIGWVALVVFYVATTFGLPTSEQSPLKWRAVSLVGLLLLYGGVYLGSAKRRAVSPRPIILGLIAQMALGLFVFRSGAGLSLFTWLALLSQDFLEQGSIAGGTFFWRGPVIESAAFAVTVLSVIIFFCGVVTMAHYVGVLGWVLRKMAWLFKLTFNISGAESIVAVSSPFIGQGESALVVRPFVKTFTQSEMHQTLVSGFATIAGSVFIAYVQLGVPAKDLLTSSMMSIPASIALSKTMYPETEVPVTMGGVTIPKDEEAEAEHSNILHALSNGAWLGLKVAGLVYCNVLVVVSLLAAVDGVLAWIGQFWGITRSGAGSLSLELIGGYILYPFTFMLGVPPPDILPVSKLIAVKIIANEFVGFLNLSTQLAADPNFISPRAVLIARYALCGFGNISSGGIALGVLSALAPTRAGDIVKLVPRALLTGILATLSTAMLVGLLG